MNIETNRLNTFNNWPSSAPVDPIRIAKAGFFYTGEGTEVQCFSCGRKISEWNYGDQVMGRHRQLEPSCAFVVDPQMSGNVPLILGRECPDSDTSPVTIQESQSEVDGAADYGLREEDEMYRNDALRLVSFVNWDDSSVSREALASAGFYHAGEGRLRCSWCGGELAPFRNFGSLGHPLEVHRMYFPRCAHAASLFAARRAATAFLGSVSSATRPEPPPYVQQSTAPSANTQAQSSGAAHNERVLSGGTWRSLGVVGAAGAGGAAGARHPVLATLAARLATFHPPQRWPAHTTQTPACLADAGFFYTGTDDQVRCFYCDGGLGKWEAGDAPWSEHARWFPHCGYVLLVKGQQFVDSCRDSRPPPRSVSHASALGTVTEQQVSECMESEAALAALSAGLDAARVRRAIKRRLRNTGMPFSSSEALIDAVLDEQLGEEPWGASPQSTSQRLARDILAETLREFAPAARITSSSQDSSPDSRRSHSTSPERSPARTANNRNVESQPTNALQENRNAEREFANATQQERSRTESSEMINMDKTESNNTAPEKKTLTLEEENRQLKEARLCKVCMDNEVSVVFLPCGHLVSCGGCGAALSACPLCRAQVRALVRAYLA